MGKDGWRWGGEHAWVSGLNGNAALVGTARFEKHSVGFLFLWLCLLGEEALGETQGVLEPGV